MNEDLIESHLVSLWGVPARSAHFSGPGHDVALAKWEAGQTDEGVTLYVTNGASMRVCDAATGRRVEFVLGLLPEHDAVAKSLAMLAGAVCSGIDVGRGDTVTLTTPLWPGAPFRTYLALPPMEEIVPPLPLADGTHVDFLPVMPLYDTELRLKKERSAEWITGEIIDQGIPWTSPTRPSLHG
ncbi:suppressor of fused domain protein [Kitasatospora paracochleata]|uniref:Suppressor of fused-like domain-containing protein n=1 Tax=Kitasatospora paracochleata TaxID=58354 RepID=A0ABT1JAK8_9ACTN|nr:suppressor of fused domain protein [Kitasatospora paracochleata]MCP2314086.1 hypothetical protein [Kitasatospora paracochleata]